MVDRAEHDDVVQRALHCSSERRPELDIGSSTVVF